tara:strand:- start:3857 stop:3967 length:111 start_codon:yes stop_codon:yes gene_type:complete
MAPDHEQEKVNLLSILFTERRLFKSFKSYRLCAIKT